ncbi:MAG TPA: trypsin-like peptidase domain-containing protein [Solirubrobacterales bacterium]|nr:trypsin-like peptidase domain-containing protein [Solirubrobacterales bacterium]
MNAERDNRRRGGLRRAATIVAAWLAGGLLVVGVLLATGALGDGGTTKVTTVRETAASTETVADTSGGETADEALYASTSDGVVEIKSTISGSSETESGAPEGFGQEGTMPEGEGAYGQEGFGATPEGFDQESESSGESMATGSGFIVDEEGTVVTAAHVVDEASSVEVILKDGTSREAEVLGIDDATDIAVIRFDASGLELQPLEIGDSSELNVGASVAAIGAPFEYAWSFSIGIVSGLDRTIEAPNGFTVSHAIQTDAAVNPGNSGGPLLDSEGKVIGVVDQIATDGSADQSSGVGFAVPSDLVSAELQKLEAGETVEHAYLGVATGTATGSTEGAQVSEVVAGSPAAEAGVKEGDVITSLDGEAVNSSETLAADVSAHEPGETVTLEVERDGQTSSLKVTLGTQPAESGLNG